MSGAIELLMWLLIVPLAGVAVYAALLAALALTSRRRVAPMAGELRRFAFIVPAHNEEAALPRLLASINAQDYPADRYDVVVIADNCSDRTANVGREYGARVLERHDTVNVGKGFALAYALEGTDAGSDAVIFVDADCTVSANLLSAFNAHLCAGEQVLQAHYSMRRASAAPNVILRELGLALVHLVRPLGKERLGASAGLKGSGMCFSRDALATANWSSFGLAEDAEQHVRVVEAGLRVAFVRDASVVGEAPATLRGASEQHRRWEAGRASAGRTLGLPLLVRGVGRRSFVLIDAALELLAPPVAVLGAALLAATAGAAALGLYGAATTGSAGLAALGFYFASGAVLTGVSMREFGGAVAVLPRYVIWKAVLYACSIVAAPEAWRRTERTLPQIDSSTPPTSAA